MIIPAYLFKLDFTISKTSLRVQKIDGNALKTYGMASAKFSIKDSLGRVWFFKKTFLLANSSIKMVLKMAFYLFSNVDIKFANKLEKLT